MTAPDTNHGLRNWLSYHVEIWAYNPLSLINFTKTHGSATGQNDHTWLGQRPLYLFKFSHLWNSHLYMQTPIFGIWEEASNPSLTADLCEEKRLMERDTFWALCLGAIFSCQDKF